MLRELRVRDLGVIDDLTLLLGPGMTALTGETGAGKTLLVEAIDLLVGGRADPVLVRPGSTEASVEGRFDGADDDVVLRRVVPAAGRSRAYIDGSMATVAALADAGAELVDLHGQHAHQALFSPAAQRAALDRAGAVDHTALLAARKRLGEIEAELATLGGDERARAHEIDLLRFQLDELDAAGLRDADEDSALEAEEQRLSGAVAHREAAGMVHEAISGEGGALDRIGSAVAAVAGRPPLSSLHDRLRILEAEFGDVSTDARGLAEGFEDDPERLAEVSERRHLLRDLRRKYGDTLADVLAFASAARARLDELEGWEERAGRLEAERDAARRDVDAAAAAIGAARRSAAGPLGAAVEAELRHLAMPRARFEVVVGPEPSGDTVTWLLGANAGEAALPLAKVASGGELARTMLALRLVLSGLHAGPQAAARPSGRSATRAQATRAQATGAAASAGTPATSHTAAGTLVFDEVDAGIGGEAAVAVGRALAQLGRHHQVLVVTHLPQVAAFADRHVAVRKATAGGRTRASATVLDRPGRIVELSRMLSGRPGSDTARRHAEELLDGASPAG